MSVVEWVRDKWNALYGGHRVHDFGVVSSQVVDGREQYRLSGDLRFGKWGWSIRLEFQKDPNDSDGTHESVNLYFDRPGDLMEVFEEAARCIERGDGPSGESVGPITTRLLRAMGGEVVRVFGRIDNHPAGGKRGSVELALVRRHGEYHFLVLVGSRARFDWPVRLIRDLRAMTVEAAGYM